MQANASRKEYSQVVRKVFESLLSMAMIISSNNKFSIHEDYLESIQEMTPAAITDDLE